MERRQTRVDSGISKAIFSVSSDIPKSKAIDAKMFLYGNRAVRDVSHSPTNNAYYGLKAGNFQAVSP
jgi:hypothetical protein